LRQAANLCLRVDLRDHCGHGIDLGLSDVLSKVCLPREIDDVEPVWICENEPSDAAAREIAYESCASARADDADFGV
jgi:hypothetical protein